MSQPLAVITGVSKGLGAALAQVLLDRGYEVVGIGRSAASTLASPRFRLVVADLADAAALASEIDPLFAQLRRQSPASIVVINNAALAGPSGTIGTLDLQEALASLTVNLAAPLVVANAFMRAFGSADMERRLINVSSGAAVHPIPGSAVYCIAKAGLEMLASAIAAEAASGGITAITVRPGIIDTPMQAFLRGQSKERLPSVGMFRRFHDSGQLVAPHVTAGRIVERLVLAPVDNGRVYAYQEL